MRNQEIEAVFKECSSLCDTKNEDYATPDDFYANFRTVETIAMPMWIGCYVRLLDKITRLSGFVRRYNQTQKITAKHESIEDTLKDGINYLALTLVTYRKWKNEE
jgi:hypothetical protein